VSDKLPQSTEVLITRLRRVAKWLDRMADVQSLTALGARAQWTARANTCWQAAARLEELTQNVG
jgi:hypothetical protein